MSETKQLWPLQPRHVGSSGLRARRVGLVHGKAYCWRIYAPGARGRTWTVERVRVRSVDDLREEDTAVDVATATTRTKAIAAIESDADVLEKLGAPTPTPGKLGRLGARAFGQVSDVDWFGEDDGGAR